MSHFYTKTDNGVEPRHFVPMAKDPSRSRPSRTTDAKKAFKESGEVWVASVTTILNMLDKPALVNWKVDQHLDIAYNLAKKASYTDYDEWMKDVKSSTREALDSAPKAGTNIHKILEDWLFVDKASADITDIELQLVENCEKVIAEKTGLDSRDDWYFEKYFLDDRGFAGCADLVSKNFKWVIDYKSKQQANKFKPGKMAYPDHTRQLGAYMQGFGASPVTMDAANLFVCLEDADVDFHTHDRDKLENGFADFLDCLSIYQRNVYKPEVK